MAKLKYTFEDYISNPSGKGSAVNSAAANQEIYEKELMSLESRNDKAKYTVYRDNKPGGKHAYYIHFEIPSSTKGFFNDVVIEFVQDDNDSGSIKTIKKYYSKFFSNDTNFVYTYAYTFKSHGVLIDGLERKLPLRCIIQKPIMRNPDNAMGYNKAIYFSYLIMLRENLFEKEILNRHIASGGLGKLSTTIKSFDQKQLERSKIEKELRDKGKKEDIKQPVNKVIKSKNLLGDTLEQLKPKVTKVVGTIGKSKTTTTTKKVKKR